ncbi:hypothetical protein [Microlunatus elymi]|nr:hypothetical protein [Microlunatus elymi]
MAINPMIKNRSGPTRPAGSAKGAWLSLLEQGANVLQTKASKALQH